MIVTRLKLPLEQTEYSALLELAGRELRNPTDQAHIILRQVLEQCGLLAKSPMEEECQTQGWSAGVKSNEQLRG